MMRFRLPHVPDQPTVRKITQVKPTVMLNDQSNDDAESLDHNNTFRDTEFHHVSDYLGKHIKYHSCTLP